MCTRVNCDTFQFVFCVCLDTVSKVNNETDVWHKLVILLMRQEDLELEDGLGYVVIEILLQKRNIQVHLIYLIFVCFILFLF